MRVDRSLSALAPLVLFAVVGCQLEGGVRPDAPAPPMIGAAEPEQGVFRGQSPEVEPDEGVVPASWEARGPEAPWGASYLAPGELSCDTPPPLGLGYEVIPPQAVPYVVPGPPVAAAPAVQSTPEAGWFDVLPPDGGPISDDFGLPVEPRIANRFPNPLYVPATNSEAAWETIAAVMSRYFPIDSEERVQRVGAMLTEGRLQTRWQTGSTIFEPWRRDSAGGFNRWQSTLQTIRRRGTLRVIPAAGGYQIETRVDKQLENLNRPERATAFAASLRNDSALPTDRVTPIDRTRESDFWIDIGRDEPLEQRILQELNRRFNAGR